MSVIMGCADLGRQHIAAGLVDEISIHVVPVLFGRGMRIFEDLHMGHVQPRPARSSCNPSRRG